MPVATIQAVATAPPYTVTLTDDLGHQWLADEPSDAGGANAGLSAVMGASMSRQVARRPGGLDAETQAEVIAKTSGRIGI